MGRLKRCSTIKKIKKMGLIEWMFNKYLTKKIKNDSTIMGKIAAADQAAEDLKASIADCERRGLYVDPELKKMVGMK
jgi:hypothetical protein